MYYVRIPKPCLLIITPVGISRGSTNPLTASSSLTWYPLCSSIPEARPMRPILKGKRGEENGKRTLRASPTGKGPANGSRRTNLQGQIGFYFVSAATVTLWNSDLSKEFFFFLWSFVASSLLALGHIQAPWVNICAASLLYVRSTHLYSVHTFGARCASAGTCMAKLDSMRHMR